MLLLLISRAIALLLRRCRYSIAGMVPTALSFLFLFGISSLASTYNRFPASFTKVSQPRQRILGPESPWKMHPDSGCLACSCVTELRIRSHCVPVACKDALDGQATSPTTLRPYICIRSWLHVSFIPFSLKILDTPALPTCPTKSTYF